MDDALKFLTTLYANSAEGWPSLTIKGEDGYFTRFPSQPLMRDDRTALDELALIAKRDARDRDCFVNVALRAKRIPKGRRGGTDDCLALPALFLDIDFDSPGRKEQQMRFCPSLEEAMVYLTLAHNSRPPSMIVKSGWGVHAYWVLDEPLPNNASTRLMMTAYEGWWTDLADARGWDLDQVSNIDRMMRLPGTTNYKDSTNPQLARLISVSSPQSSQAVVENTNG